jgi:hypothetical protein
MTDIVTRLNDTARLFEEAGDHQSLPREAADEIERLRTAVTRIAGKGPAAEDTLACEMREIARAALTAAHGIQKRGET